MRLKPLPPVATWRHVDVREGYEVLFIEPGPTLRGVTTAIEDGVAWSVTYEVALDENWRTRRVAARTFTAGGERSVLIEPLGANRWAVDGTHAPQLDGCVDVDFESSAVTNTIPIHRLTFVIGEPVEQPAAFVRADDLRVERMEQRYTFVGGQDGTLQFDYVSTTFDFACVLTFDASGLILDYPGIAVRDS